MDHKFNESVLTCEAINCGAFHGARHAQSTPPPFVLTEFSPVRLQSAAESAPRRSRVATEHAGEDDAVINSRQRERVRKGGARAM